ncbi:hypothetical protein M413DRAFT_448382 [Hebeloma cylindrosporum]|uniref:Uncharacterized protein n=1 Tax=Hebeloma cylindrosporum TaxID=76867 RepID=A0A0C3C1L8_HEBCY|nr:hypothetical protein M413DRAFT_448382 [Hebeloma cylindrosporum h7]
MDALRTLKNKEKELELFLEKCTPLAGPINYLPPEILGEIFLATLDSTVPTHDDESTPPMLFCHVSTFWRQTALSTPGLWTRLAINRDATAQDIAGMTSGWFSFAGGLPLSLQVQITAHPSLLASSLARSSFMVAPQRSWRRIHNLEITVYWMGDAVRLLNILVDRETDLERLVIQYTQWTNSTSIRVKLPPLNKLKRLVLSNLYLNRRPYDGSFDNIPWNQLTNLSMVDIMMTPTMWKIFLRRCTHLQHGASALQEGTVFPSMISLKVAFKNDGDWGILNGLSFPSLQTLCLGSMKALSTWRSSTSSTLDAPLVKNLTLFKVRIQYPDLVILLERMVGLRALILDIPIDCSPIFHKLTDIQTSLFLPCLVRLSIYHWRLIGNQTINIDKKGFLRMIRSRWYPSSTTPRPPRAALSSVSLRTSKDMPQIKNIQVALSSLTKEGLFLHVGLAPNGYPLKKVVDW